MSEVAAVKQKASRLGYKSVALRTVSSIGLSLAGVASFVGSFGDMLGFAASHTSFKVLANSASHFEFTSITPAMDFGQVAGASALGGVGALLVTMGVLQGTQSLGSLGAWLKGGLGSAAATTVGSIIIGALVYGGSISANQDQVSEAQWVQQQFKTSVSLPDANKVYNSNESRYEYYPAVFSGINQDKQEIYYTVQPVLNANGDSIGLNVQQVTKPEAQKAQEAYLKSLAASQSRSQS